MQALAENGLTLSPTASATIAAAATSAAAADEVPALEDLLGHDLDRSGSRSRSPNTVLAVGSAAATGRLALAALELAPGDEVVVAPGTGRELIAAVLDAGARPVFADVDAGHGCLTAETVAAVLSPDSRAVLIRHAYGAQAPIESIATLARQHGVRVVEDASGVVASRSHGADLAFGVIARDGFGIGGYLSTDDERLARRLRRLRDRCSAAPTAAEVSGMRRRVTEMAGELDARREAAFRLRQALMALAGLGPTAARGQDAQTVGLAAAPAARDRPALPGLALPGLAPSEVALPRLAPPEVALPGLALPAELDRHALTALPLIIDPALLGVGNQRYAEALTEAGVKVLTREYEQPLYRLPWRRPNRLDPLPVYGPGHCPVAEDRVGRTLVLLDWGPAGPADVEHTARAIAGVHNDFLRRRADRAEG